MYVIYSHTNTKNAKRYVGWASVGVNQTCVEAMTRRWLDHCYDARRGSKRLFHNAIRKHGEDAWQHEVIDVVRTLASARRAEILWIGHYRAFAFDADSHGYNMTRGGDGVHGYEHTDESRRKNSVSHKGLVKSLIHRERLRISNTGKKRSPETCVNIGSSKRGEKHPFYGKHLDEAVRLAIRLGQPNRRSVIQYTKTGALVEIHASTADAQRKTQIPATNIVKCCKGHLKTAGKFVWRYADGTRA